MAGIEAGTADEKAQVTRRKTRRSYLVTFPDVYNEDWLFFFDDASTGKLANSCLKATQLCYYPFAKAERAAWQEFGDVIAEGLYALLHLDTKVENATREYWSCFLEARRTFLEAIVTRSQDVHPALRGEMLISVQAALKSLLKIKPDLCERYVKVWREDLADWKRRIAVIPELSIEATLRELRLGPRTHAGRAGSGILRHPTTVPDVTAGPAAIPRSGMLNSLLKYGRMRHFNSIEPETDRQDPMTMAGSAAEYAQAMLAARMNSNYCLWSVDEADHRLPARRVVALSRMSR